MNNIPVFIINLERDIEKKHYMEKMCSEHSLAPQFIKAVYGHDLSSEYIEKITDKVKSIELIGRELTPSEIGCALSHISVYEKMIRDNIEIAIIFEDDITIEKDFFNILESIDKLPKDWESILLGHYPDGLAEQQTLSSFWQRKKITTLSDSVRLILPIYGTHAYMINLRGVKRILKGIYPLILPIDDYMNNDERINLYGIEPVCISLHYKYSKNTNMMDERDDMRKKFEEKKNNSSKSISIRSIAKKLYIFNFLKRLKFLSNILIVFFKKSMIPRKY